MEEHKAYHHWAESKLPEGIHRHMDLKYIYTDYAWHILNSPHINKKKFSGEYYHDEMVEAIITTLTMSPTPEYAEQALKNIFEDENSDQRNLQRYLAADIPTGKDLHKYITLESWEKAKLFKKRRKKWEPKLEVLNRKNEINFYKVWAELARNFVYKYFQEYFPQDEDLAAYIREYRGLNNYQLEQWIDNYVWGSDDDDDDKGATVMRQPEENAAYPRAYVLASLLVWKSRSTEDLHRAIEVLENIEWLMKDEYDKWQNKNLQEEFHAWAYDTFEDFLRQMTCAAAHHCDQDIYTTVAKIADEEEESGGEKKHKDADLFDFFTDICMYIDPPSPEAKLKAYRNLRTSYNIICQQIESDTIGDFDDDNDDDGDLDE